MGDWNIVTLVTLSSGVSRDIHHKCKHPLNPTKLYVSGLVESSRVLVYWLEGHNILGWCMYIWLWKYTWLRDKTTFGSSLPFYLFVVWSICAVLLFLQWSSTCWCEQMRELSAIIRVMEVPLLSRLDLGSALYVFC